MSDYSVGDRVRWHNGEDDTEGIILEQRTENFEFNGQLFAATDDDPTFIVRSENSGHTAAHHGRALRKA